MKKLFNQWSVTPCIAATVTTMDSYLEEKNLKISDAYQLSSHLSDLFTIRICDVRYPEAYSELCKLCKMEVFAKIVNGFQLITIFAKSSFLDVWQGSEYATINKSKWIFNQFARRFGSDSHQISLLILSEFKRIN